MIKVFYKSMTIEFECLADVIAFVEHFNPPDKLNMKVEDDYNKDIRDYNIKESSKIQCKNTEELMARNYLGIKDVYRLSSDKVEIVLLTGNDTKEFTRIIKYIDFERMIDHALKEMKLKVPHVPLMATVGSEHIEVGNPPNVGYNEIFYKCHKIYTSLDGKSYHVYGPGILAVTYKTLEMAKSAVDLWEDSQKKVYEPIKFEKPQDSKIPQLIKDSMMVNIGSKLIEINTQPKKKRGRPKKVTEHDDKVLAIAGSEKGVPLTEDDFEDIGGKEFVEEVDKKIAESIIEESKKNKEDLIMEIDDVAKEMSKSKAMVFTEEALRKIFQKAYKPALKTDIKATYPLTQLDPQMCNRFATEVSDKLGMKCTLSYKVDKAGFKYILMKL